MFEFVPKRESIFLFYQYNQLAFHLDYYHESSGGAVPGGAGRYDVYRDKE